ncbi:hypothetical protein [Streptomyces venezuelae]
MTAILPERPTVLDSLPTLPDTAPPVILPGLLSAVGIRPSTYTQTGYQQSLTDGFTETYEEYCERVSSKEAAS